MVAEPGPSLLDRRPLACGFLLGTVVMTVAFVAAISPLFDPYQEETASGPALLFITAGGYVAAIAMTIVRARRRTGLAMLVALTPMFPAAFAGVLAANLGLYGWW